MPVTIPDDKPTKDQVLTAEAKPKEKVVLAVDRESLKKIKLVAIAHSAVARRAAAPERAVSNFF